MVNLDIFYHINSENSTFFHIIPYLTTNQKKIADLLAMRIMNMLKFRINQDSVSIITYFPWEADYEGRYSGRYVARFL